MNFRLFLENLNPSSIVHFAQQARQESGITRCAKFGDCNDVVNKTVNLLKRAGIKAKLKGSQFWTDDDMYFDHSWVIIYGNILDPTIDQFFSELDVDLETKVSGIYYSDYEWDGPKYIERYK